MKLKQQVFLVCAIGYAGTALAADGFERYRVILSRMPFGEAPPEPVAEAPPPPPPSESFAKHLRVCSIIESADTGEVRVGIVDNQTQRSFVLSEGEEFEEIELVSASLEDEEAVLRKGQEIVRINLLSGELTAVTGAQAGRGGPATAADAAALQSYRDRRQARQELRRQRQEREQERLERQREAAEMASRYTPEELRTRLQDYNMEVIRAGMPPLPIELTPEQDAQLVAENVLPPIDGSPPTFAQPGQQLTSLPPAAAPAPVAAMQPTAWQAPAQEVYAPPPMSAPPVDTFEARLLEELNQLRLEELLRERQALEEALEIGF